MKIDNGTLYFKMKDLKIFFGRDSDYEINKLVEEGYLTPIQRKPKGDRLYHPKEVIPLRVAPGKCGPILPVHRNIYMSILSSLKKEKYDISNLMPDERGFIESSTMLWKVNKDRCQEKVTSFQDSAKLLSSLLDNIPNTQPDILPFDFNLGNKDVYFVNITEQDVDNVVGCFGYADETNVECTSRCGLMNQCFATRFDIMSMLAKMLDNNLPVNEAYLSKIRVDALKSVKGAVAN